MVWVRGEFLGREMPRGMSDTQLVAVTDRLAVNNGDRWADTVCSRVTNETLTLVGVRRVLVR